VIKVDINDII